MFRKLTASLFALALSVSPAFAGTSTLAVTPGSGSTYQVITNGSGNFVGMFGLCDGAAAAQCVAVKAASTAAGATDPALVVAISPNNSVAVTGTFWQATQPISAASLPLPTGASTAAGLTTINTTLGSPFQAGASIGNTSFAATQSGSWNLVNISGTVSLPTGAATAALQPTNAAQASTTSGQTGRLSMGAVTTSPPSYTTAQTDPLSLDTAGNLRINCITGCSSSSSITGWAGSTIGVGTIQAFGATEGTIGAGLVPAFNVHITNANGNGSATSANSSPVVIASDQAAVAVKAASGTIASGAIASGALAAGSISSGAAVSGAFAAGAIADLAHGQGTMSASVPVAIASNQSAVPFAPQAIATGGALSSPWLASAVSNNATNVKGSAGTLYTLTVTQSTTTAVELKLYNSSSSPTCSSATGLIDIIPIPSNATSPGVHLTYPVGRAFSTGVSFCLVAFGNPAAGTDNGNAVVGITVSMTYD